MKPYDSLSRLAVVVLATLTAVVLLVASRADMSTPGRRAGWVGTFNVVTRVGRAECKAVEHDAPEGSRELREAHRCLAGWLEERAAVLEAKGRRQ